MLCDRFLASKVIILYRKLIPFSLHNTENNCKFTKRIEEIYMPEEILLVDEAIGAF
jgi:hypothetical protein